MKGSKPFSKSANRNSREDDWSAGIPARILMTSDLEVERWSVISDRGCEATALTHPEARQLVHRLGGEGRHGLCIITDEAASRMREDRSQITQDVASPEQSSLVP